MALSTQRAVSDGTLVSLDLSINYLDRSEIAVYFDTVLSTAWAWVGDTATQITFTPAVPNGVEVLVKRTTDSSKLRHEFSRGAAFTADMLDEDLVQVMHIAQESTEAYLTGLFYNDIDMQNHRIRNIGTAIDDSDALSLGQYKADANGAYAAKVAAEAARDIAVTSATDAATSSTLAGTYATDAGNSATAAATSAASAATSAINAANASRLTAGAVTTGAAGSSASATIVGPAGAQVLNLTIPRGNTGATGATGPQGPIGPQGSTGPTGATGPANTLSIGTVVQGGSASATITGSAPNQTLNLTLPQGPQGPAGTGDVVSTGPVAGNELVLFNGTSGSSIKRDVGLDGILKATAGVPSAAVSGTDYVVPSGSITGNAGTATTLATARTINGTSFNGSSDIVTTTWGAPRTLTIGNTGKTVDGTIPVGWSLTEIGAAPVASPSFTGVPTAPTAAAGTGTTQLATTAFVSSANALKANIASPTFTGIPAAPTAAVKTSTTQIANTAFADRLRSFLTGITSGTPSTADRGCLLTVTTGITIPASVFTAGDTFSIYNNSAVNITLTQGAGLTLRLGGTALTGNRTLAQRGISTVVFISATEAVIGGMGLT